MERKRVLLIMQRKILSDSLIEYAKSKALFDMQAEQSYATAALTAEAYVPAIVMLEIPESGPWKSAEKCLTICDMMKRQSASCKCIILCPEGNSDSCAAVITAKIENRIDDFLYYEASINYLFSKLESFAG